MCLVNVRKVILGTIEANILLQMLTQWNINLIVNFLKFTEF